MNRQVDPLLEPFIEEGKLLDINEKFIPDYYKDNFKSYIDSKVKKNAFIFIGILGFGLAGFAFIYWFITSQLILFWSMIITYGLIIAIIAYFDQNLHPWNFNIHMIGLFFVISINQVTGIILYFINAMPLVKFIILSLGVSWAPTLLSMFFLYLARDYINIAGRIHILLGWIYKTGIKKENPYSIIELGHLYMLELTYLLEKRINLIISNTSEIINNFYTNLLGVEDYLNNKITNENLIQDFSKIFKGLKSYRTKEAFKEIDMLIPDIIKLTKNITNTEKIKYEYYTAMIKVKKFFGKTLKFLIPVITPLVSFLFKYIL